MRILLLAPHPYYQERGTPIAVNLLVNALSERGDEIDILTFHEGEDKDHVNTRIFRIRSLKWVKNIRPGFSVNKLICDVFIFFKMFTLIRKNKYDLVHAVEEASFMALIIKMVFGIPYVHDIDSSMTNQCVDKYPFLKVIRPLLVFIESIPMKYAKCVVPVCDALAKDANKAGAKNIFVLKDVSLLNVGQDTDFVEDIRTTHEISGTLITHLSKQLTQFFSADFFLRVSLKRLKSGVSSQSRKPHKYFAALFS